MESKAVFFSWLTCRKMKRKFFRTFRGIWVTWLHQKRSWAAHGFFSNLSLWNLKSAACMVGSLFFLVTGLIIIIFSLVIHWSDAGDHFVPRWHCEATFWNAILVRIIWWWNIYLNTRCWPSTSLVMRDVTLSVQDGYVSNHAWKGKWKPGC